MSLIQVNKSGKFLYELLPHYFPEGYLTMTEMKLWEWHYKEFQKSIKH